MSEIIEFDRFGHEEAWLVGCALVSRCQAEGLGVTVLITLGEQRVFHAALPGTSADNDGWAERKARTVAHFGLASRDVYERYVEGNPNFFELFALPAERYAPFGGAVPIAVRGTVVGALAISGLDSDTDHQLAVDALNAHAAAAAEPDDNTQTVNDVQPSSDDQSAPLPAYRTLAPGQRCQIWIAGPDQPEPRLVLETSDLLIEAPNWCGDTLYVNGNGALWAIDLDDARPELRPITHRDLPAINNDHVLDPDGEHIYLSAMDGHIYRGALAGGQVERLTHEGGVWHFLHGVSPDGRHLAYVRIEDFSQPGRLAVLDLSTSGRARGSSGGTAHSSHVVDTGDGHLDGPEWSPDGEWIYVNTESFSSTPGHAQLARIPDGGGALERLITSDTVDWFPHLSPNGEYATYLAFPSGTQGHPADLDVEVRVVSTGDWNAPVQTYPLFGGQGTINVNSWSPDSSSFAFIAYPRIEPPRSS